jgi:putative drug exporter of the RND superfamily
MGQEDNVFISKLKGCDNCPGDLVCSSTPHGVAGAEDKVSDRTNLHDATIILSYFTAMGAGSFIFDQFFGYSEISYRIPLYTFIFLVALGVDYNIMLISRVKEEARTHPIKEAISLGLAHTSGVISSAGLILAATFAVLITQPIMEPFMFGFTVAIGVLIDTFLIRTILVPAIVVKFGKYSFWPQKAQTVNLEEKKSIIG